MKIATMVNLYRKIHENFNSERTHRSIKYALRNGKKNIKEKIQGEE